MNKWLQECFDKFSNVGCFVTTEKTIDQSFPQQKNLFSTEPKICDILTCGSEENFREKKVAVRIGVVLKNDKDSKGMKLAVGLVQQLQYLMNAKVNRNDDGEVDSVSGIIIPVKGGMVELVECTWNSFLFTYEISPICLEKGIFHQIHKIYNKKLQYLYIIQRKHWSTIF